MDQPTPPGGTEDITARAAALMTTPDPVAQRTLAKASALEQRKLGTIRIGLEKKKATSNQQDIDRQDELKQLSHQRTLDEKAEERRQKKIAKWSDRALLVPIFAALAAAWISQALVYYAFVRTLVPESWLAEHATAVRGACVAVAAVAATALETLAIGVGRLAALARQAGDAATVERLVMWAVVSAASSMAYLHFGTPIMAILSVLGAGCWELRERRLRRNRLAAAGGLETAPPRFGWRRWLTRDKEIRATTREARRIAIALGLGSADRQLALDLATRRREQIRRQREEAEEKARTAAVELARAAANVEQPEPAPETVPVQVATVDTGAEQATPAPVAAPAVPVAEQAEPETAPTPAAEQPEAAPVHAAAPVVVDDLSARRGIHEQRREVALAAVAAAPPGTKVTEEWLREVLRQSGLRAGKTERFRMILTEAKARATA